MMKKALILLALLVLFIGLLNIGNINQQVEKTAIDSAGTAVQPGNPSYPSTMNTAQTIAEYWYVIVALVLMFIAWVI